MVKYVLKSASPPKPKFDLSADLNPQQRAVVEADPTGGLYRSDDAGKTCHENVNYMPAAMAQMGAAMHRAASQFALVAQDASATGDLKKPLAALAKLSGTCVACHAAYRLH